MAEAQRLPRPDPPGGFSWAALGLLAFLSLLLAGLLRRPIEAADFDLWYHLNAGRWILQHRAIPATSFFSFLEPPREWADYYWLFQAAAYGVHAAAGFRGLVLLRAVLFGGTLVAAAALALGPGWKKAPLYEALLVLACAVILAPRCRLVRPHLFTYLFLAVFLLLLETSSPRALILPVLAALWGNVHGVSYPVVLLVCGAYAGERLVLGGLPGRAARALRLAPAGAPSRHALAAEALSMAAVFLTPLGARLVETPFQPLEYAGRHIGELMPYGLSQLLTLRLDGPCLGRGAFFNLMFAGALLAALAAWSRRRMRVSHLILLAGGAFLLTRGQRFMGECALLMLPLLRAEPPFARGSLRRLLPGPVFAALAAAFAAACLCHVRGAFERVPPGPVDLRRAPRGAAAFLKASGASGRLLNNPDTGGWWEWELGGRVLIAADMQMPFLFRDADYYEVLSAFSNPDALAAFVARYRPEFIAPSLAGHRDFPRVVAGFPDYVPVFFDDVEALYADRRALPDLARRFALPVDPFGPALAFPLGPAASAGKAPAGLPAWLGRMLEIDPFSLNTRVRAAVELGRQGEHAGELAQADEAVRLFPEEPAGHLLRGHALGRLGRTGESEASFREALARATPALHGPVLLELAAMYRRSGRLGEALVAERLASESEVPPRAWVERVSGAAPR